MAKKKFPYILIKDAKNGFRTQLVGGNGEPLMTSEVLESAKAVRTNLVAMQWATLRRDEDYHLDYTKEELESWLPNLDLRYEGKSEAIYKMFKIVKQTK